MITSREIKQLRHILGLTQKDLAEKLGTSIKTVANYEGGGVIPAANQKLLVEMLDNARNSISHNTGNVNMGNHVTIVDTPVKKESADDAILSNFAQINKSESIEIPLSVWNVIELQAKSLEKRDSQIDELIKMLKDQKGVAAGAKGVAPGEAHG